VTIVMLLLVTKPGLNLSVLVIHVWLKKTQQEQLLRLEGSYRVHANANNTVSSSTKRTKSSTVAKTQTPHTNSSLTAKPKQAGTFPSRSTSVPRQLRNRRPTLNGSKLRASSAGSSQKSRDKNARVVRWEVGDDRYATVGDEAWTEPECPGYPCLAQKNPLDDTRGRLIASLSDGGESTHGATPQQAPIQACISNSCSYIRARSDKSEPVATFTCP